MMETMMPVGGRAVCEGEPAVQRPGAVHGGEDGKGEQWIHDVSR